MANEYPFAEFQAAMTQFEALGEKTTVTRGQSTTAGLTNIAQTWGQIIPFSAGLIRIGGKQIWSSEFYSILTEKTRTFIPKHEPNEQYLPPIFTGPSNVQKQVERSQYDAIDIAYSFGVNAIPASRRILKRLRIDGSVVYDIATPDKNKFAFDIYYGDEVTQCPLIKEDMLELTPYYPDQIYIVVWGLVNPIPKDVDAEFEIIDENFRDEVLNGRTLNPVQGNVYMPNAKTNRLYTYSSSEKAVRTYSLDTQELLSGPTPVAPLQYNETIIHDLIQYLPEFNIFIGFGKDGLRPCSRLHFFDPETGQIVGTYGSGSGNCNPLLGAGGIAHIVLHVRQMIDTPNKAVVLYCQTNGNASNPFSVGKLTLTRENEEIVAVGSVYPNFLTTGAFFENTGRNANGFIVGMPFYDNANVFRENDIVKAEPLPLVNLNQAEVTGLSLYYKETAIFMTSIGVNIMDRDGKIVAAERYPGNRVINLATFQITSQMNADCGYFGMVRDGDVLLVNLKTAESKFYDKIYPNFEANYWDCNLQVGRRIGSNFSEELIFPTPQVGGKIRLKDWITACYVATGQYAASDITFDQIDDLVFGALLIQNTDINTSVGNIRKLYRIEKQENGSKLHFFRNRPASSAADVAVTMDASELAVLVEGQESQFCLRSVVQNTLEDMPQLSVQFIDVNADFAENTVSYKPPGSRTNTTQSIPVPLVLDRTTAIDLLNRLFVDLVSAATKYEFRLPYKYLHICAGDQICVVQDEFKLFMRIIEDNVNGDFTISCKANSISLVLSPTVTETLVPDMPKKPVDPNAQLDTEVVIFDVPALRDSDNSADGSTFDQYAILYAVGRGWRLGYLARKQGEQFKTVLTGTSSQSPKIAVASNRLGDYAHMTDPTQLAIDFVSGSWDAAGNKTHAQLIQDNRLNIAFYGSQGRWEVVQFQGIADGKVYGIIRGCRGTEVFTHLHQNGDLFVIFNEALTRETRPIAPGLGQDQYKAVTQGFSVDAAEPFSYTPRANTLRPLAPWAIRAVSEPDGDVVISWRRQDRKGGGWGSADAPQSDPLTFQIHIYNSQGVVVSTGIVNGFTDIYTFQEQDDDDNIIDDKLTLAIYQISDNETIGRGFGKKVTINVE